MKKELYCGFDSAEFNKIRDVLDAEGVKYKYKVFDRVTSMHVPLAPVKRGDTTKQYYLYVSNKDFEKAQWLIEQSGDIL